MSSKERVLQRLQSMNIPFELHHHAPVKSMEECLALPFVTADVMFCKNILLCNRQQSAYYLYVLPPDKALCTSTFSRQVGSSRLSFAPDERLMELLALESGALSPLGLWFDLDKRVQLVVDRQVMEKGKIAFHPCARDATCIFPQTVFWEQVAPEMQHDVLWV